MPLNTDTEVERMREVFDLVAQDPTFDDFFEHIGSSSFYKSAPKKGAH